MSDVNGLFGQLAIEKKFVTADQVQLCLKVQAQLGGKHHLGALLINRGYLTEAQLQEVLALQRAREAQGAARPPPPAASITQASSPGSTTSFTTAVMAASAPQAVTASRIPAILESAEKR